jgi:hypothetical protein
MHTTQRNTEHTMTTTRPKTPWNPSKSATARVKHPIKAPKTCPCCTTGYVTIEPNETIYGWPYGDWPWVFVCSNCQAYVGLHPFTDIPLGTLADKPTREARKSSKASFIAWFHEAGISRGHAYRTLADSMKLAPELCHFAMFTVEQCKHAQGIMLEH